MKKITFRPDHSLSRDELENLQDALRFLAERARLLPSSPDERQKLLQVLAEERASGKRGEATQALIRASQKMLELPATGRLDEASVHSLNGALAELGAFGANEPGRPVERPDEFAFLDPVYNVRVRTVDGAERPIAGLEVTALSPAGPLGRPATTDAEGVAVLSFHRSEFILTAEGEGPDLSFRTRRRDVELQHFAEGTEDGVLRDFKPGPEPVVLFVPEHAVVVGRVRDAQGAPAAGWAMRLSTIVVGDEGFVLGGAEIDEQGRCTIVYKPPGEKPSLRIDVLHEKEVRETTRRFAASAYEVVDVIVESSDAEPEYRRLLRDAASRIDLGAIRENDDRKDLTVLSRETGWDARLLALASLSSRLSEDDSGLPAEAVYGLLRAGLPWEADRLAKVEPRRAAATLRKLRDDGVVGLKDEEIEEVAITLDGLRRDALLKTPAVGGGATYGELLKTTGLDEDRREIFFDLYREHRGTGTLWEKLREANYSEDEIKALRAQGKLAFLTGAEVQMTARLMEKGVRDPAELVEQGFSNASAWKKEILENADVSAGELDDLSEEAAKRLAAAIPESYVGDVATRLEAYSEDMARKLRRGYPTRSVLAFLQDEDDQFQLPAHESTMELLRRAVDGEAEYRLGETPPAFFLQEHPELLEGLDDAEAASESLSELQRVYQITPDDESIPVLFEMKEELGLSHVSAYDLNVLPQESFESIFENLYRRRYGRRPLPDIAPSIFNKIRQVSETVYNLFAITRRRESDPPVTVLAPPVGERAEAQAQAETRLRKHFPTVESLFGSTDFCECEHCRSVLSPAAYMVDLLQFLDREPGAWSSFLAGWRANHGGEEYPHQDGDGRPMTPYEVLVDRRPDLPHLALTCENTHTEMPYIDLVNEIMEYSVAHGRLAADAARDTDGADSEDLIAEPRHTLAAAYEILRGARYPLDLPFDLHLETVRKFCNYFEAPPARVLETFLQEESRVAYETIFFEDLKLSAADVELLTTSVPFDDWHDLYGYASAARTDDLRSAKTLSRRLGVNYREMVALIRTAYVNPELFRLTLLSELGVDIGDVRFYREHRALLDRDWESLNTEERRDRREVEAFAELLTKQAAASEVSRDELEAAVAAIPLGGIVVLKAPDIGCDFERTIVQFADGSPADPEVFIRLNLFVRLQRKLGWEIEELDQALAVLLPSDVPASAGRFSGLPLRTALVYLSHLNSLSERLSLTRLEVLQFWSSPDEESVRDLLAGALDLSVAEFETLRELAGIDPLVSLISGIPTTSEQDHAWSRTRRFVEIVDQVRESGLSVEDLDYLFRHRFDEVGEYRAVHEANDEMLRSLVEEIRSVAAEAAETASPEARRELIEEIVKQRLAAHAEVPVGVIEALAGEPLFASFVDALDESANLDSSLVDSLLKVARLVAGLGLGEREVRHFAEHGARFDGVNWELPTTTPADAQTSRDLFARFLRLAAYAHLRRNMAGDRDDLIDVFEAEDLDEALAIVAKLTRRTLEVVAESAAELFSADAPEWRDERDLARLWASLRLTRSVGVDAATLRLWTSLVDETLSGEQRAAIVDDLRTRLKARFESEAWRRVAQPIFDELRRRRRDALASFLLHREDLDRPEELYEHFLVDPGMEPVVRTSRIRLAIGSLQLFIQRSLLNLERKVHPSALDAKHWEWMKRYRVWEANRKIFLFPENWLEPEFRDNKSHLFRELEGALLEGDVSADLVEDVFLKYLRQLDELARLDLVAMHIEEDEENYSPEQRVLHVFGRTFSRPHRYFHRRYAHGTWTPWMPITAKVEGDHLAPVVWRDRLYLFWATFLERPEVDQNDRTLSTEGSVKVESPEKRIEVQLHWSEFLGDEWSHPESSGFDAPEPIVTDPLKNFDPHAVFLHVSKEPRENGDERGVYIHLAGSVSKSFYLAGRNSSPQALPYHDNDPIGRRPENPYLTTGRRDNRWTGDGGLAVSFYERLETDADQTPEKSPKSILKSRRRYSLLPANHRLTAFDTESVDFSQVRSPRAAREAFRRRADEIESLMKPIFYQDERHTFFVEPEVREKTIVEIEDWIDLPDWIDVPTPIGPEPVLPDVPIVEPQWPLPDPLGPDNPWTNPGDLWTNPGRGGDWLVNSGTVITFDDVLIGPAGDPGLALVDLEEQIRGGSALELRDASAYSAGGLSKDLQLRVIDQGGLDGFDSEFFEGNLRIRDLLLRRESMFRGGE